MPAKNDDNLTPPYVAFATFKSFVQTLKSDSIPDVIDRSVLQSMSGMTQSQLLSALRFLSLIDDKGAVDTKFRHLVDAYDTDKWATLLADQVTESYKHILGELNVKKATHAQLVQAFRTNGKVDNDGLLKGMRFFIKAAGDAKMEISKHVTARRAPTPRAKSAKPAAERQDGGVAGARQSAADNPPPPSPPPSGMISFPLYFPGKLPGSISVPENITEGDCEMISTMLPALVAYAKRRGAEGK